MRHVVILARRPRLGLVKSRLGADIGAVAALRFYRTTVATVARRLGADGRWTTWLGVTPDSAVRDRRGWPPGVGLLPQGTGDLGERMARCMTCFGMEPVVLVGSDIPDIGRRHVACAFEALKRNDLVFGPSGDGGYWLVGAGRGARVGRLFEDVRWSGPHALADTMANIRSGVRTALIGELDDIDDGAAFRRWRAEEGGGSFSRSGRSPSAAASVPRNCTA